MKSMMIALFLLLPSLALAEAQVAFLENYDGDGKLIELEPGSRFSHVAIRVGDRWLHAHPYGGVQLSRDMTPFGRVTEVLTQPNASEPTPEEVAFWLGRSYDPYFDWSENERVYCAELIGKLLGHTPTAMTFSAAFWGDRYQHREGAPGMSPEDNRSQMLAEGWKPLPLKRVRQIRFQMKRPARAQRFRPAV